MYLVDLYLEELSKVRDKKTIERIFYQLKTDWEEKAKEVREKILKGEFVITGLEDFIGYLYAYMLYEDVPTLFELFMKPTPPAFNLG
jgi:hypothetical protein